MSSSDKDKEVTNKKVILTVIPLIIVTTILCFLFFRYYNEYKLNEDKEVSVNLEYGKVELLDNFPDNINYSPNKKIISTTKKITNTELVVFFSNIDKDSICIDSIKPAFQELHYKSNTKNETNSILIFIICGLVASLGAQARSMSNLINVIIYLKELDLKHYWPWYVLRPILSFVVSILFVLAFYSDVDILSLKDKSTIYLFVINFLVGFAIEDVLNLLRNLSKRIFNTEKK